MATYIIPRRSFLLRLLRNCPEAKTGLDTWQEGKVTFKQAMMMAAHRLFMANEELQRKLDQRKLDYANSPHTEP